MSRQNLRLLIVLAIIVVAFKMFDSERDPNAPSRAERQEARAVQEVDELLTPSAPAEPQSKEGLAAAIVIDVSGSMKDKVDGHDGKRERKIDIARRAALDLVDQFARYAQDHQDETVQLGLYEFSRRRGDPDCRTILALGAPDRERAARALDGIEADGGTPIGQAMITAKLALDAAGLSRRHLLVVTDGENTDGIEPGRVTIGINKRPEVERPSIYFVAFDVAASRFDSVRDAGGLVLSASNANELNTTLDSLLRGSILVEK